jgi:hypothetical protein
LQQEFGFSREKSALAFGLMLLPLALPVALMHSNTFNEEFDYWAGTFMLVVFALGEAILFAWVFGMNRGWNEINKGAEMKVPRAFYFIIKYVTPVFLLAILIGFVLKPEGKVPKEDSKTGEIVRTEAGDIEYENQYWRPYVRALFTGREMPEWNFASDGMIGKLQHRDIDAARAGKLGGIDGNIALLKLNSEQLQAAIARLDRKKQTIEEDRRMHEHDRETALYQINKEQKAIQDIRKMSVADREKAIEEQEATREKAEAFYDALPTWRNIDRLVMVGVYVFFCVLVYRAWARRRNEGRA